MNLVEQFYNNKLALGTFNSMDHDNNNLLISVSKEKLVISTCQKNGWIRVNVYYNDENKTKEEYYEK